VAESAPDYDAYQSAFHEAFAKELRGLVDELPLPRDGGVLDVPCGNGFYTEMLAQRLSTDGRLIAVDACEEYLSQTCDRLDSVGLAGVVLKADAYRLPFPDRTFDLIWCAQSLVSLDPARAVAEMARVVKPAGTVVILEADAIHHVLLSWPAELEAALPAAVLEASAKRYGDAVKLSPARRLRRILRECGFQAIRRRSVIHERSAPFDESTRHFLRLHFEYLRKLVYPHLSRPIRRLFDTSTDLNSDRSVLHRPDAEAECVNVVYEATCRL
jgi:ubiquinone/menaquinone biosynthesis C-methylase UbiE